MPQTILNSKRRITLPAEIRARLGLKAGDRVDFHVQPDGSVRMTSQSQPFEALLGCLGKRARHPVSVQSMDEAIRDAVRRRWRRATRKPKP